MDIDDDNIKQETEEVGSDELLSADNLRLPEDANPLVRIHAVRAWLSRRQRETKIEMGEAALSLQDMQSALAQEHLRRREYQERSAQMQRHQTQFTQAQEKLASYEEAEQMLEEAINHVTIGERLLVEYYLELDNKIQDLLQEHGEQPEAEATTMPNVQALMDVQQRVERVGATYEE